VFDNLVESSPKKRGWRGFFGGSFGSAILHAVLIVGAVKATHKVQEAMQQQTTDTLEIFIDEQEQEEEPEVPDLVMLDVPVALGFQNLDAPIDIPTEIPPVDLNQRFNPADYSGLGVEGGIAAGVEGGQTVDLNQVFVEAVVDETPMRLSGPQLVYPRLLQDAGIQGHVTFEFIVGEDGHPEAGSFRVVESTNRAFERPARDVIMGSVYRPGRIRGQPVRVLVRQTINYTLTR
jgi:hypothetical protein